jgi:hypothetical protein
MLKKILVSLIVSGVCSTSFSAPNQAVSAHTIMHQGFAHVNAYIRYNAGHEIFLTNPTDHVITYNFEYRLCINSPSGQDCDIATGSKTLNPGEQYSEGHATHLDIKFVRSGFFVIWGTTTINGEFSAVDKEEAQIYVQ